MMRYKAILHDWDDTITSSFDTYKDFYFIFAELNSLKLPELDSIKKYWGITPKEILTILWPEVIPEIDQKYDLFITHLTSKKVTFNPKLIEGVGEAIKSLYSDGYMLGVISSGSRAAIENVYKTQISADKTFHTFIHDPSDTIYTKPDSRAFDKGFEILKSSAIYEQDVVYVGDSLTDYMASKERGLEFIAVTTGVHSRDDFLNEGLDSSLILNTFAEIKKLV